MLQETITHRQLESHTNFNVIDAVFKCQRPNPVRLRDDSQAKREATNYERRGGADRTLHKRASVHINRLTVSCRAHCKTGEGDSTRADAVELDHDAAAGHGVERDLGRTQLVSNDADEVRRRQVLNAQVGKAVCTVVNLDCDRRPVELLL